MIDDPIMQYLSEADCRNTNDNIAFMNFLATMAIGCNRLDLTDMSKLYSDRLNKFVVLLGKTGYKNNRRLKGSRTSGIQTLFSKAFYNLRIFNG